MKPRGHEFGGNWTDQKLDVLTNYFQAYQEVLKNLTERR